MEQRGLPQSGQLTQTPPVQSTAPLCDGRTLAWSMKALQKLHLGLSLREWSRLLWKGMFSDVLKQNQS